MVWYLLVPGCYVDGLAKTIKERLGYGLTQLVDEQTGEIQRIYFSRSEWTGLGAQYLQEILVNPALLQELLTDLRQVAEQLMDWSQKQKSIILDSDKLAAVLEEFHAVHHQAWALGQVVNVLELENSFLTDYLKDWLKGKISDEKDRAEAFLTLVTPVELSGAQTQEREMLKLASSGATDAELLAHAEKYAWLQYGWNGPKLSLEFFKDQYQALRQEGGAAVYLENILEKDQALVREKKQWLEKINPDPLTRQLFKLLEELLFLKAYRMDALFMSYAAVEPYLRQIAKENYLSLGQVFGIYSGDLPEFIRTNSFDQEKINSELEYSVKYFDGEEIYCLVGNEACELMKNITVNLPALVQVSELTGQSAFPGLVRGTVKVINRAAEMDKFKPGDILVSNVTDPSLLPIMKQASAFVTNMGGLTCHAAIVARELQTPCVVGTKVATKIFQDGDTVEVNAEKGIVRKI